MDDIGLKVFILSDFDYLLRDKGIEARKYDTKLHESIQSPGKDFFCQNCLFGESGEEIFDEENVLEQMLNQNIEKPITLEQLLED